MEAFDDISEEELFCSFQLHAMKAYEGCGILNHFLNNSFGLPGFANFILPFKVK
jgi:hypothetical protein